MLSPESEHDLRAALAGRAASVPTAVVQQVREAPYRVRTVAPGRVVGATAAVLTVAAAGAALAQGRGGRLTPPQQHPPTIAAATVPLAYVGHSPRLEVTKLPAGFRRGPDVPVPVLPGKSVPVGVLPEATFVAGSGDDAPLIVVSEGTDGEGPVDKLLGFAARDPSVTSEVTVDGDSLTVVDVAAANAGAGYIVYFAVSPTTWALIGGGVGVSEADLVTVAEGIITAQS